MRRRVFRSGRFTTGTRGGLPTRRCTRSRWREQVGWGVLYLNYIERLDACVGFEREAIGPERPNLNGMLIDGPILEERYEAGWNMCAGWLSRDMLRRRSATGGGRISGCPVFKESHLFYTKSDLYSVLFVNKVCEYAGIARKAEEMLFFLSDFSGRFEINFYICNDAL